MDQFLLIITGIAFWAAIWGLFRPYKGLSRKQFGVIALVALVIGVILTPTDPATIKTASPPSAAPAPVGSISDLVSILAFLILLAGVWGLVKPYKGLRRGHFAAISAAAFVGFLVALPELTPEQKAKIAAEQAAGKAAEEAEELAKQQGNIVAKAKDAIAGSTRYTKADFEDTYAAVGPKMFGRLNELERGAFLVAAESSECNRVVMGAVSLSASRRDAPKWYVDCDNGNRFMVNAEQADAALDRAKAKSLKATTLASSCTTTTIAMCNASLAQKNVNKSEVVVFCKMRAEEALISEADFDWGYDFSLAGGDTVRVSQNFTAQNAFGAELKSRYICEFDAAKQMITSLIIENGLGSQQVI